MKEVLSVYSTRLKIKNRIIDVCKYLDSKNIVIDDFYLYFTLPLKDILYENNIALNFNCS